MYDNDDEKNDEKNWKKNETKYVWWKNVDFFFIQKQIYNIDRFYMRNKKKKKFFFVCVLLVTGGEPN